MRPAVPLYCRCTPIDLHPFLRKPVSSITTTARERQAPPVHRHTTHFSRCRNPTLLDLTHVACHLEEEMFVDFVRGEEGQCITCLPRSSADHTAELLGRECALLSDPNGWPAHSQQIGFFQAGVNDDGRLVRA